VVPSALGLNTGIEGAHSLCRVEVGNVCIGVREIKSRFLKGDGVWTGWSYYGDYNQTRMSLRWMDVIWGGEDKCFNGEIRCT